MGPYVFSNGILKGEFRSVFYNTFWLRVSWALMFLRMEFSSVLSKSRKDQSLQLTINALICPGFSLPPHCPRFLPRSPVFMSPPPAPPISMLSGFERPRCEVVYVGRNKIQRREPTLNVGVRGCQRDVASDAHFARRRALAASRSVGRPVGRSVAQHVRASFARSTQSQH